jgi:membrane fusion protein (multidrug efflux system)
MPRLVRSATALGLLALVVAALVVHPPAAHDPPGRDAAPSGPLGDADAPLPVRVAPVVRAPLALTVTANGRAAAWRQVTLNALVPGRVDAVLARESDAVRPGAVLVRLDAADLDLALRQAHVVRAQAQAQVRDALASDDRLADPGVRATRDSAARIRAGLPAAELGVARAELDRARADVVAPFGGRVAGVRVVAGQWVRAGDELLTVVDVDPIRVEVPVLEGDVVALARGGRATVTFAAFPRERFDAVVESVNPVVDRESRAATVTLRVRNPSARVLPGMYAHAELQSARLADRVLVPRSAVLERDGRTMLFVYAPTPEGHAVARWRYVATGAEGDSLVEIVPGGEGEGVRPGERVLVEGHESLVHEALVRAVSEGPARTSRPARTGAR